MYIDSLKKDYPKYNIYSSNINKLYAANTAKYGVNQNSFTGLMELSEKVGLRNKK